MQPRAPSRDPRPLEVREPVRRVPYGAEPLPPVDERLVMPEARFEILDEKVEFVPPSDEPHGTLHAKLAALLEAHVAAEFEVAVDMLTRTSMTSDMAPDASVFPRARDAATGGRQIEALAFEVLGTETLSHAARKARALLARGVRRVFAIDVDRRRALAWSERTDGWEMLPPEGTIEDHALAVPLPLRPLVEAARSDDAVARALLAKKNPVIVEAIEEARRAAKAESQIEAIEEARRAAKAESLLAVLGARGLRVAKKAEKRIRAADEKAIDGWLRKAASCAGVDELFEK